MHDAGCLGLVHWDDPEGWYGEGGGRRVQDGFSLKKNSVIFEIPQFLSIWDHCKKKKKKNCVTIQSSSYFSKLGGEFMGEGRKTS